MPPLGPKGGDGASYSSAVVAEIAGVRQYVQVLGRGLAGVEAQTGRFLWGYNAIANNVCNAASPVASGDYVFASTAYNAGSGLVKVVREGDSFRAEESYFSRPTRSRTTTAEWSWWEAIFWRKRPEPRRSRLHRVRYRANLLEGQGPGLRLGVGALC